MPSSMDALAAQAIVLDNTAFASTPLCSEIRLHLLDESGPMMKQHTQPVRRRLAAALLGLCMGQWSGPWPDIFSIIRRRFETGWSSNSAPEVA